MTIEIVKAGITDLNALAQLFNEYRIFYGYNSDINGARDFLHNRITNSESIIFLSKSGESYTGFLQMYPLFSSTRMKRLWMLNDLFVAEAYRGSGISKAMIEAAKAISVSSNACGLLLETAKTNIIGNRLYTTTGFELEKGSNFYFWSGNK